MSILSRWTLVLISFSLVLVLGGGVVLEYSFRNQENAEREEFMRVRRQDIQMRLEILGEKALDNLQELFVRPEINNLLAPIAAGRRAGERGVVDWASLNASRFGLDELIIMDDDGRLITAALWPASYGQIHPQARFLRGCLSNTPVLWQAWTQEGSPWILGAVSRLHLGSRDFTIVGGIALDVEALESLAALSDVESLRWEDGSASDWIVPISAGWQFQKDPGLQLVFGHNPVHETLGKLRRQLILFALMLIACTLMITPWLAMGLSRPVTRLSRAVAELRRGEKDSRFSEEGPREIRELGRALNELADEIQAAEGKIRSAERRGAWRNIARRIAHELRNGLSPLSLALDNVETVASAPDEKGQQLLAVSLQAAREQLQSLDRLVREFHSFARSPRLQLAPLDVRQLCESVCEAMRISYPEATIQLGRGENLLPVHGDLEQLRRALQNLLLNAVEAAPSGIILLDYGAGPDPELWWLKVEDQGPGLDPKVAQRFGEPYLTTKEKGTGLGLSIVLQIAQAHGGTLRWRPASGGGTVMQMSLKLQPDPAPVQEDE